MRKWSCLTAFCCLAVMAAALPIGAAPPGGDYALTTIVRWSGQGTGPDDPAATYIPWVTPIEWLKIPYSGWTAAEKAKVPQAYYDKFWAMVQERVASGADGCDQLSISSFDQRTLVQGTQPVSVTNVAKSFPLVVLGTVVSNQPAWDFRLGRIATITYIRVDEVIKGQQRRALPAYMTVVRDYGSVRIEGTNLCSRGKVEGLEHGGISRQVSGPQQIIVAGRLALGNTNFIETAPELIFRVDSGDVLNPSMVPAYPAAPMSLATFRTQVQN